MISLRLPAAFAISSVVLASVLVTPAYAESPSQPPTKVVHFADLDLNSHAGVEVLYGRIKRAAREVCPAPERTGTRIASAVSQDCIANALRTAVDRVDRPLLTAYYDERDGHGINRRLPNATASN